MNDNNSPHGSKTGAGAAGVGGGTLLVVIANSLSENNKAKPLLIWAAPSVAVFLGGLWLWLQVKIANYLRDREVQALINNAKRTLEEALNNPKTSEPHRARIRRQLEKLEQVSIERQMERIKAFRIVTEEEFAARTKGV
jgi:hypothetical protein